MHSGGNHKWPKDETDRFRPPGKIFGRYLKWLSLNNPWKGDWTWREYGPLGNVYYRATCGSLRRILQSATDSDPAIEFEWKEDTLNIMFDDRLWSE